MQPNRPWWWQKTCPLSETTETATEGTPVVEKEETSSTHDAAEIEATSAAYCGNNSSMDVDDVPSNCATGEPGSGLTPDDSGAALSSDDGGNLSDTTELVTSSTEPTAPTVETSIVAAAGLDVRVVPSSEAAVPVPPSVEEVFVTHVETTNAGEDFDDNNNTGSSAAKLKVKGADSTSVDACESMSDTTEVDSGSVILEVMLLHSYFLYNSFDTF